jgi:hypothetical protein
MKKLYDLDPAEVSLVPKGANKKKFLIFKRDVAKDVLTTEGRKHIADTNFALPSERKYPIHDISHARNALARVAQHGTSEEQSKVQAAVYRKYPSLKPVNKEKSMDKELLEKIKNADPEVMKKVEKVLKEHNEIYKEDDGSGGLSPRAQAALKAVVRILTPFKEEINDDVLDHTLGAAGFGVMEDRDGGPADLGSPMEGEAGVEKEMNPDHMAEAKEIGEKAYKEHLAKLGYQKYPPAEMQMKSKAKPLDGDDSDEDEEEEDVSKQAVTKADGTLDLSAVPASVRPALEAIYKGNQELVKKNVDLESQLKTERDQRKNKELVEKADSFKHLGLPKEDIVAQLKEADERGKESFERVCKNFEALDSQAKNSKLFTEIGSSGEGRTGSTNWEMIEKAAEGAVAKSGQALSKEAAVEVFLKTKDGQKMYKQYKDERGGI